MPGNSRYLQFADMRQPVCLRDCDELLPDLPLVFPGWDIDSIQPDQPDPVLTLYRSGEKYRLKGFWLDEPLVRRDSVDALCALVAEVMRAYVRQDDSMLCLHGAAAEFGGRLIVFPSAYRAGKSVLSACLAAACVRLFCDDILPLDLHDSRGIAPGLAPRLRIPLPENLGRDSREFIEAKICLQGERYAYLDLDEDRLAARGERSPVGAFVLLERQAGAAAELEAISEAEVLKQVVWQNFAREAEAPVILDVLSRLVAASARYRLHYDRAEDAVALLRREFADWPEDAGAAADPKAFPVEHSTRTADLAAGHYRQNPAIGIVQADDQYFLADRGGAAIHHLNQTGSSIWGLLAEPITQDEIVEILATAFPDADPAQLGSDVSDLLRELLNKNLLQYGGS